MFDGFTRKQIKTQETTINLVQGGHGYPVLFLHGYPQTHVCWHRVAPILAERFTVVCADLRGFGDSAKPPGDSEHLTYSKRVMAQDQVEVMKSLGFTEFAVVGHDRGARVAHRMALDVIAFVRIRTLPGHLPKIAELAQRIPEVTECHRITGEDCFILKVYLPDIQSLDTVLDRFLAHGQTTTSIVQSSPIPTRPPRLPRSSKVARTTNDKRRDTT